LNSIGSCRFKVLGDARLDDHAAVADQHDVIEVEAPLQLLDPWRQDLRIAGSKPGQAEAVCA
jgi:hypothetical protein